MQEDQPIEIPAPPRQPPPTLVKILGHEFRGDSFYIILGAFGLGVLIFLALKDNIFLASVVAILPTIGAISFVSKFVEKQPRLYFAYWVEWKIGGQILKKAKRGK